MTDTPEIAAARKALMEARAAWQSASDAAWAASIKYDAAEARLRDLIATNKEPSNEA